MLIKVLSVVRMLSKLPPGVRWREGGRGEGGGGGEGATGLLNKGEGSNRLPGLVTKQAVEFPHTTIIVRDHKNRIIQFGG